MHNGPPTFWEIFCILIPGDDNFVKVLYIVLLYLFLCLGVWVVRKWVESHDIGHSSGVSIQHGIRETRQTQAL